MPRNRCDRLREFRENRGISRRMFAELTGYGEGTLARIERGNEVSEGTQIAVSILMDKVDILDLMVITDRRGYYYNISYRDLEDAEKPRIFRKVPFGHDAVNIGREIGLSVPDRKGLFNDGFSKRRSDLQVHAPLGGDPREGRLPHRGGEPAMHEEISGRSRSDTGTVQ